MEKESSVAYLTTLWIGGFFFWMLSGFRGKFSDMISEKKRTRNFWTGYIIQILFLAAAVYGMFVKK
jgi:hypothetical protein